MCAVREYVVNILDYLSRYVGAMLESIHLKAIIATFTVMYTTVFAGDVLLLNFYFAMVATDLFLRATYEGLRHNFSTRHVLYWMRKVFVTLILVVGVGMISYAANASIGITLGLANWFLTICLITEFVSIINNAVRLGLPIPRFVLILMQQMQKRVVKGLSERTGGGEEMEKELNDALNPAAPPQTG